MNLEDILEKIKRLDNGGNGTNIVCFIVAFDLLYFLNFTNEDVFYQKQKIGKSFLRLSFFDSPNPQNQNLAPQYSKNQQTYPNPTFQNPQEQSYNYGAYDQTITPPNQNVTTYDNLLESDIRVIRGMNKISECEGNDE